MGMTITAAFYESYLRSVGSLPMRLMSVAILELDALGEHELAKELMRIREKWASTVARRARDAIEPERLQHIGQVIAASLTGGDKPRPAMQFTLSEAHRQARALGVGHG